MVLLLSGVRLLLLLRLLLFPALRCLPLFPLPVKVANLLHGARLEYNSRSNLYASCMAWVDDGRHGGGGKKNMSARRTCASAPREQKFSRRFASARE